MRLLVPLLILGPLLSAAENGLGLIPPDATELAALRAATPQVVRVRPNALRVQRLRDEAEQEGRPAPAVVAVADHAAVVLAAPGPETATTGDGADAAQASDALPGGVDNSALPAFPPIGHQGSQNACVAWASTYYQLTYEHALARGLDAKNGGNAVRLSPAWTYNLLNNGFDGGLGNTQHVPLLIAAGAVTWAEMPYGSDVLSWLHAPSAWRAACTRRVAAYTNLDLRTAAGITAAKGLLANGRVIMFATYVLSWTQRTLADDPATASDDAFAGQKVAPWQDGNSGGHMMTIVGYRDDLWCDVDGDGQVDAGEKGAFKIANSWGTSDWNAGYRWVLYDAFLTTPALAATPAARQPVALFAQWITLAPPSGLYAEITLTHSVRKDLTVQLGIGMPGDPTPPVPPGGTWPVAEPLYAKGGLRAFSGAAPTSQTWTFTVDFAAVGTLPAAGATRRFFVGIKDGAWSTDGVTLSAFRVVTVDGTVLGTATGVPVAHDADVDSTWTPKWAWVDVTVPGANQPPVIAVAAAAGPTTLVLP